jgi:hypothetical protein
MDLALPPRPTAYRVEVDRRLYDVEVRPEVDEGGRFAGHRFTLTTNGDQVGFGPLRFAEADALADALTFLQDAHQGSVLGEVEQLFG